jgi:hypothetical protein
MEKWEWVIDIFTFIGIIVSVIIALIAIVWITCFAVKLLIKIFGVKVGSSFDIMKEDIVKKAEAKKERKEIKRKAAAEHKMELLNLKLENKQKIHEMKKQKLSDKLKEKEDVAKQKILGDDIETSRDELVAEVERVLQENEKEEIVENAKLEVAEKQKEKKTRKKSNKN